MPSAQSYRDTATKADFNARAAATAKGRLIKRFDGAALVATSFVALACTVLALDNKTVAGRAASFVATCGFPSIRFPKEAATYPTKLASSSFDGFDMVRGDLRAWPLPGLLPSPLRLSPASLRLISSSQSPTVSCCPLLPPLHVLPPPSFLSERRRK